ncbi:MULTISPECIES: TetR/AcrR family transcriptional regulator [Nocardiaceae]|uniref:TetR/AcrR family transcriptional regulator n=1 Tax=Rhodococcoides yunnanense TaxID=278209 RepID=A0ABU4BFP2_9NOCA|nr:MULTISPECIES: TetR/AcrR family transcriptional regulator [Rhodococcus]MDI9894926.1 TetR/AcrR family transcriptional regulator [Rhodococcus sp. IEGM 1381]MDV6263030.1 TetR/AcrR family transcriptional regulator [Rhodococcus yunnanensis]
MPYRRTPAVQARLDAGREKLFAAAIEVLSTHGYAGLSIASVAAAAGVSAGSVYTHFEGKADLVVAIFREVCGREVAAVVAVAGYGSTAERVTAVVETFAGRALKNRTMAYALLAEPVDPAVDAERLVFRRKFTEAFADAIAAGIAAGEIPEQDAAISAAGLVGAVGEVLVGPLSSHESKDPVPGLVALSLRALGVRDGHA